MENAKTKQSAKVYKFAYRRPINVLIKNQRSVLISAYDKKQASRMFGRLIEIVERCDAECVELIETKRVSKNKMNAYMFDGGYIKKEIDFLGLKDDGD